MADGRERRNWLCNLHLSSRFSSPFSHPYLLKQDDITNQMVTCKPNTLTFLVSFHQQCLNAYYRSLEGESYKCGKAEFTLRRLSVMPTMDKEQKNSAVVETHLTTKLPRRTSYRGALGINSTIPSYLARRRKVVLNGSMRNKGTVIFSSFFF